MSSFPEDADGKDGFWTGLVSEDVCSFSMQFYHVLKGMWQDGQGVSVVRLSRTTGCSEDEVVSAMQELVAAGFVYCTVDERTWAVDS